MKSDYWNNENRLQRKLRDNEHRNRKEQEILSIPKEKKKTERDIRAGIVERNPTYSTQEIEDAVKVRMDAGSKPTKDTVPEKLPRPPEWDARREARRAEKRKRKRARRD